MINVSVKTDEAVNINVPAGDTVKVETHEDAVTVGTDTVCRVAETNYERLNNLPKINSVTVIGSKEAKDYGLFDTNNLASNLDIKKMFK